MKYTTPRRGGPTSPVPNVLRRCAYNKSIKYRPQNPVLNGNHLLKQLSFLGVFLQFLFHCATQN